MQTNHPPARAFIAALQELERSRSTEAICQLFAPDATLDSIAHDPPLRGNGAIAEFWKNYVAYFKEVQTTFTQAIDTPDISVLEWRSVGRLSTGTPITYRGVTMLGWAGGQVKSFRVYYDSAAFVPEYEKHLKRKPLL